jgi:hypothetical protein
MALNWNDLKPSTHPFEPTRLKAPLRELLMALGEEISRRDWRGEAVARIDQLIKTTIGAWAWGWKDYGGDTHMVVYSWCCPVHSLFPDGYAAEAVPENAERILAAVAEWREYLESLERIYARARIPTDRAGGSLAIAAVIARIVTHVAEVTRCSDAWYSCAIDAIAWFLEHLGLAAGEAEAIADKAFAGKFESWVEPDPDRRDQATDDAARLAYEALKRAPP